MNSSKPEQVTYEINILNDDAAATGGKLMITPHVGEQTAALYMQVDGQEIGWIMTSSELYKLACDARTSRDAILAEQGFNPTFTVTDPFTCDVATLEIVAGEDIAYPHAGFTITTPAYVYSWSMDVDQLSDLYAKGIAAFELATHYED